MAYNVSEGYREQVYSGEALYDCRLKINNVQVPNSQIQTIKISSPIIDTTTDSGSMFHIGTFISQKLEIKFKNLDGLTLTNNPLIELEIGLYVNNAYEYVPIGKYLIDELGENYQKTCEIECMDFALKFKTPLDISKLFDHTDTTESGTVKWMYANELFEAICGYYGVTAGTYPNVNNNKKIYFYDSTISGKEYIMMLAELFGGNAKIGRDGSCNIIPLKNYTNIEINALTSKKFEVGDTYELTRVCLDNGRQKFQAGANVITVDSLPSTEISTTSYYYLTTDMKYYIYRNSEWQESTNMKNTLYITTGNMFITQQADVDNIYNAVQGFSVTNITCENRMDLSLDCSDIVKYVADNGTYYQTFYDNTTTYNGVAMGTVEVNLPIKTKEETTNVITSDESVQIRTLRTTVNEQEGKIETIITETNPDVEGTLAWKEAQLEISVEEINQKIQEIADITVQGESYSANLSLINVNESEPIRIEIRPVGTNISYLYPRDNLYPSDTLYMPDRILNFHNDTTNEDIPYTLPGDLLYYDENNYDEFILDYGDGVNQTCQIKKKVGYNADGTTYVLSTPQTINYTPYPIIHLTNGNYTITLPGYNQGRLFVRLMASNIYTTEFATRVEMNSAISQTASSIDLSVDQKLSNYSTTTEMNSAISLSANQITSTVSETYATKTQLTSAVSTINQTTNSISLEVSQKMNTSDFTQASIVTTINEGTSSIKLDADKINLTGYLTVSSANSTYATKSGLSGGTTTIDGACITTGTIKSSNYSSGGNGTSINLSNGVIDSKNFKVSSSGSITATGGTIGGFTIASSKLYKDKSSLTSSTAGVYIGTDGISLGTGSTFKVTSSGALTCTNATISGTINATSGNIGGCTISDGQISINGQYITQNTMAGNRLTNNSIETQKLYSVSPSKFISGTASKSNMDSFVLETNVGYLKCGNGVSHPYVSALNIAKGSGGLSFRNGTSVGNVGSEIASIYADDYSGAGVLYLDAPNGINIKNGGVKVYSTGIQTPHIWVGDHVINDDIGAQISMDYNLDLWSAQGNRVRANGVIIGGTNSTLNIKQNIKERDTSNVLNILKDIKIYDYNYIPEFYNGEKSYGYIIDYLEKIPELKEYVKFVDIDKNPDYPTKVVENQEEWIKFLLACVIELNKKLEEK